MIIQRTPVQFLALRLDVSAAWDSHSRGYAAPFWSLQILHAGLHTQTHILLKKMNLRREMIFFSFMLNGKMATGVRMRLTK